MLNNRNKQTTELKFMYWRIGGKNINYIHSFFVLWKFEKEMWETLISVLNTESDHFPQKLQNDIAHDMFFELSIS
jgi:hypothetical protein